MDTAQAYAHAGTSLALGGAVIMPSLATAPLCLRAEGNATRDLGDACAFGAIGIAHRWIDVDLGADIPIQQIKLLSKPVQQHGSMPVRLLHSPTITSAFIRMEQPRLSILGS